MVKSVELSSFIKKWKSGNKTLIKERCRYCCGSVITHVPCYWTLKNKIHFSFQVIGQRHKVNLPLCASYQQCRAELCTLWKTQEQFRERKFNSPWTGLKSFSEESHLNFPDGKKFISSQWEVSEIQRNCVQVKSRLSGWRRAIENSKSSKTILVLHVQF